MAIPLETLTNEEASDWRHRQRGERDRARESQPRSMGKVDDINIWLEHELVGAVNGLLRLGVLSVMTLELPMGE